MLDWIQGHLDGFRQTLQNVPDSDDLQSFLYEMTWIDDAGSSHSIRGVSLRDCVQKAIDSQG